MEGAVIINPLEILPPTEVTTLIDKYSSRLNGIQLIEILRTEAFLKIIDFQNYIFLLLLSEEMSNEDLFNLQSFLSPFFSKIINLDLQSLQINGFDLSNTCHTTCRRIATEMGIEHRRFSITDSGLLQKGQSHSVLRTTHTSNTVIIDPTLPIRTLYDPHNSRTYNSRLTTITPLVLVGSRKFLMKKLKRYYHPQINFLVKL